MQVVYVWPRALISWSPRVPGALISHWPRTHLTFSSCSSHAYLAFISCSPRVPRTLISHCLHTHLVFPRVPHTLSSNSTWRFNWTSAILPVLKEQRLKHGTNRYLNFPACVWTVTENPRTPNVFLEVQNTEYLAKKGKKSEWVTTSKYTQQSYILRLIMSRITMPNHGPVFKINILYYSGLVLCAVLHQNKLPYPSCSWVRNTSKHGSSICIWKQLEFSYK